MRTERIKRNKNGGEEKKTKKEERKKVNVASESKDKSKYET